MIRLITCLRRRPDITPEAFRAHWESPAFDRLIVQVATAAKAVAHVKNATLAVSANDFLQDQRGGDEPFDGVIEYFFESAAHLPGLLADPAFWDRQKEMRAFQETFVDPGRSSSFFTQVQDPREYR